MFYLQNSTRLQINQLPLFLLFPEFDTDMMLPPGFPIKIEMKVDSSKFNLYDCFTNDQDLFVNVYATLNHLTYTLDDQQIQCRQLWYLRATSLIVNQNTHIAWMEALQKKPFIYTIPNYTFNQDIYGDGNTTSYSVTLQPVAMIPLKIILEPINNSTNEYFFPNPYMLFAFPGGFYSFNTDIAMGSVRPGGYMPYQIDRIQVLGQNGEEYYLYRNDVFLMQLQDTMTTMDSYETNIEHDELCERNPSCHPEGIHRNRIRTTARSGPYVIDLSNNTAGYRGATNISLNQLKAEQLTINFTIRTFASATPPNFQWPTDSRQILVPFPATSLIRVSALYPTQFSYNASFNAEKVAAPILLQTL